MHAGEPQLGLQPNDVFSVANTPCSFVLQVTEVPNESHLVRGTPNGVRPIGGSASKVWRGGAARAAASWCVCSR